jgi:hypothetical protein
MNPFVEYLMPSRDFNCEAMIIIDVPDVKALVIGIEIKSTRNPLGEANIRSQPIIGKI